MKEFTTKLSNKNEWVLLSGMYNRSVDFAILLKLFYFRIEYRMKEMNKILKEVSNISTIAADTRYQLTSFTIRQFFAFYYELYCDYTIYGQKHSLTFPFLF